VRETKPTISITRSSKAGRRSSTSSSSAAAIGDGEEDEEVYSTQIENLFQYSQDSKSTSSAAAAAAADEPASVIDLTDDGFEDDFVFHTFWVDRLLPDPSTRLKTLPFFPSIK
jgi:hypothetical protein